MKYVADFHLHGKYSRAVSKSMILSEMARVAQEKGIDILTASDFTHPVWLESIKQELVEDGTGLMSLRSGKYKTKFILSTEISCIYKQNDKLRRIHSLIFAPNISTVEKIITEMNKRAYNLRSDGRPIIGLSAKNLFSLILEIDKSCMLVPCHVWTPHFGLYGSASGFDSIKECFEDLEKYICAVETGLSSDPEMNWQIKELNNRSILSFSDAHSLPKMGREATVFVPKVISKKQEAIISYSDIKLALERNPTSKLEIGYTIEFYPEEGKYHYSGHRSCGVSMSPKEIEKKGNKCPVCSRVLTEGVFVRLQNLSGGSFKHANKEVKNNLAWYQDPESNHPPYIKLVPLLEIAAESLGSTVLSRKSQALYSKLISTFGSEFVVLIETPIDSIRRSLGDNIADAILKVRMGDINIKPGFDGEYGKVSIWKEGEANGSPKMQLSLDM